MSDIQGNSMVNSTSNSIKPESGFFNRRMLLRFFFNNLVWFILLVILAICSIGIEGFFQIGIFINIFYHTTFVGILAVGLSFCILTRNMDLSVESTMAFAAMFSVWLAAQSSAASGLHVSTTTALIAALGVGVAVGLVNGFMVVSLKINSFIATLAMFISLRGFGLALTEGRSIFELPETFASIAHTNYFGIPLLVIILVSIYMLFQFVLGSTRFGRIIYLIGGSETAPFRAGIQVKKALYQVFILSGILAGFAGWLLASRINGATPSIGNGMLFEVFAAVVIGGVSLTGGVGRLSGVFAGALLLSTISTAINIIGMSPYYLQIIRGSLLLIAVLLDTLKTHLRPYYD